MALKGMGVQAVTPQVQSNWSQVVTTALDYIRNKPSIPSAQVNSDWNASSGVAQVLNKPTVPFIFNGTSKISNPVIYTNSATVLSGVVGFNITVDGTSGGTALFPNGPITSSLNWYVNDSTALYPISAIWSNGNKTLTLTVNKSTPTGLISLLGLNLLGSPIAAANGVTVNVSIIGN